MLLLTTLIWGGTFAATKALLSVLPPMGLLTWRFGLGAILFCILFARELRRAVRSGIQGKAITHGMLLGFLLFLGFGLQTMGLQFTSSGHSGFITVLYVAITPLLQIITTRRVPSPRVAAGVATVLVGLWSLSAPPGPLTGLFESSSFSGFGLGDALTLGCAFTFAIYILVLDRVSRESPIAVLTAVQLITITILSAGYSLAAEEWKAPAFATDWGLLFFLSFFATVLTTYWQTRYQKDTVPTRAAVIFTLESVFAAIVAVLFMGEHLGTTGIVGGAVIVAGLLIVEVKRDS